MFQVSKGNKTFVNTGFEFMEHIQDVQTYIIDPPYNIGYDYKSNFKDKLSRDDYAQQTFDLLNWMFVSSTDDSSCFYINYPDKIAELYPVFLDSEWKVHQWLFWVYPSNIGVNSKKFTKATRSILWLVKDEPKINIKAIQQPYKNPSDKRIQKLIESGKTGTNLYDWWEINMCKNVSKDKNDYVNQIPEELLRRLILTTTNENDLVADPMCGSGSTIVTASKLNRKGLGMDINADLIPLWQKHCEQIND
jgi:site-specific DNA-methyltransferase (adenine-specific)